MTPAGIASVTIRESPSAVDTNEFAEQVDSEMERVMQAHASSKPFAPPFPSQRIVWHVIPSASRGTSRLVVNVFDGARAYAYEQEDVGNSAPPASFEAAIDAMSGRLFADIARNARMTSQPGGHLTGDRPLHQSFGD